MSYNRQMCNYGYLTPTGVKTEKAFWLLAPVASLIPMVAVLFFVDVGPSYSGPSSIFGVAVGFTTIIVIVAVVQIAASLWMRSSFREEMVYLPTVRNARRLMATVGVPVLVSLVLFELLVSISYGVEAFLFIIGTFIAAAFSGMFGTTFWYRMRKTERTLPCTTQRPVGR